MSDLLVSCVRYRNEIGRVFFFFISSSPLRLNCVAYFSRLDVEVVCECECCVYEAIGGAQQIATRRFFLHSHSFRSVHSTDGVIIWCSCAFWDSIFFVDSYFELNRPTCSSSSFVVRKNSNKLNHASETLSQCWFVVFFFQSAIIAIVALKSH